MFSKYSVKLTNNSFQTKSVFREIIVRRVPARVFQNIAYSKRSVLLLLLLKKLAYQFRYWILISIIVLFTLVAQTLNVENLCAMNCKIIQTFIII